MTVGVCGRDRPGRLLEVVREKPLDNGNGEAEVELSERTGVIHADLRIGTDLTRALSLRANEGLCSPGVKLHGAGFIVTADQAKALGLGRVPGLEQHIRPYLNGRDLTGRSRNAMVIDLFGLAEAEVRQRFPDAYQWVLERVRPEREQNNRAAYRDLWWVFGEPRSELRPALTGLARFAATVVTAKHSIILLDRRDDLARRRADCDCIARRVPFWRFIKPHSCGLGAEHWGDPGGPRALQQVALLRPVSVSG